MTIPRQWPFAKMPATHSMAVVGAFVFCIAFILEIHKHPVAAAAVSHAAQLVMAIGAALHWGLEPKSPKSPKSPSPSRMRM